MKTAWAMVSRVVQFRFTLILNTIHLSDTWEHTLNEILNHDNKSEVRIFMRSWAKHNKLDDMTSLLIYDLNDFTPTGTLQLCKKK